MNRAQTRGFLARLCALLPHTAPAHIDPVIVRCWHNGHLEFLEPDHATEIADHLAATWNSPHFPRPADFETIRRDHRLLPLGSIETTRSGLLAARAAVAAANPIHERRIA